MIGRGIILAAALAGIFIGAKLALDATHFLTSLL